MKEDVKELWLQSAQNFQQTMAESMNKAFESFQNMDLGEASAKMMTPVVKHPKIKFSPEKLQALQHQYMREAGDLWADSVQGRLAITDRRFADAAWAENPMAVFTAASYLLNAKTLTQLADAVETDAKTRARIRFAVEQINAATAPSNFMALNAEAQQKAIETQGKSIAQGIQNLLHDMQQGHVSMTDESLFEVGKNVATTEGAVVF
jgi:polyhydroxyalkanoate synthase